MGSSGSSPIIGPPFTAQMMPSSLTLGQREGLAVFFNIDTLGSAYTPPTNSSANSIQNLLPKLSDPLVNESLQYMQALSDAMLTLKKQQNYADTQSSLWNKERWVDTINTLMGIAGLRAQMLAQSNSEIELFKTIQEQFYALYTAISNYAKVADNANVYTFSMADIQSQYLAGTITPAEYNADVTIWNNNAPAINTEVQAAYSALQAAKTLYQSQLAINNQTIAALNASRAANNIAGTIPPQVDVSGTYFPPPILPTNLPQVSTTDPPSIPAAYMLNNIAFPVPPLPITSGSLSAGLDYTPIYPGEAALFNQITQNSLTLNTGSLFNYNANLYPMLIEVNLMSTALVNYQQNPNSSTLAAYMAARTRYLNYVTAHPELQTSAQSYIAAVGVFNAPIDAINDQIDAFNKLRSADGEPLIPRQEHIEVPTLEDLIVSIDIPPGPPPPTTNPLDPAPSLIIPHVAQGSQTPTTTDAFLAKYYNTIFDTQLAAFKAYTNVLSLQDAYRAFLHLVLNGKTNTLPNNSYLENYTQVYINSSSGADSAGGGVSAIAAIVGLDNNSIGAVISQALFSSALASYINAPSLQLGATPVDATALTQALSQTLALVALNSLQTASLFAGLPALGLLSSNLEAVAPGSPTTDAAIALSALKSITGLIGSGGLEENIATALSTILEGSGLTPTQITDIIKIATSAVSVGVLLLGVLGVAKALNLPGLTAQVLANASDDSDLVKRLIAQSQSNTVGTVLDNPVSVIYLKEALANAIESRSLANSRANAQYLANQVINQTLANRSINTDLQLRASLNSTLTNANFSADDKAALTAAASRFVRDELNSRGLDAAYVQRNLNNQLINNPLFLNQNTQAAIAAISKENPPFETVRQFRDALSNKLQATGTSQAEASDIANQAAFAIQPTEFKKSLDSKSIDQAQLTASLTGLLKENADVVSRNVLNQGLTSEQQMRDALAKQLRAYGVSKVDAEAGAAAAAIVPLQADPLKTFGNGQILSSDQLAAELARETSNQLKLTLGPAKATDIGNQLALLLVGAPPSSQQVYINDVNNTASAIYQLKDAVSFIVKASGQKATDAQHEDFARTMKPTVSTLDLLERFLDPANSLVLSGAWGLMYSGTNAEPSNYKKSIDIRI